MATLKLAWYGDDFTGATDTLATAARAGLRCLLFLGIPQAQRLADCGPLDCLGIAGAARSMAPAAMRDELRAVGQLFASLAPQVLHYKICSTFDSSPDIGNIATAIRALRPFVSNPLVAIVGGQPSLGRYCVFGHLFARAGSAGEIHRIDRHPTMRQHPVTPMRESDLRQHLALQGLHGIATVDLRAYDATPDALGQHIDTLLQPSPPAVLFDVSRASDLSVIGKVIWQRACGQPLLAVGASSVVQALAAHWQCPADDSIAEQPEPLAPADGPVLTLAGSLSPLTAQQVRQATSFTHVDLDPLALLAEVSQGNGRGDYGARLASTVSALLRKGRSVMVNTSAASQPPTAGATRMHDGIGGAATLAKACASWLDRVLKASPVRRLGIAGGDTSSYAVQALDAWGLSYLQTLSPGVALCRLHSDAPHLDGMQVALKGGQMGPPQFFELLRNGS